MPGFVFYNGPSILDGAPILGIAITESTNRKTGDIVQTYIIRADINPVEALKTHADHSVCGMCKHRPASGGACYVNVDQGVNSVYKAFTRGRYPHDIDSAAAACEGRIVRLGTYGDPMAIPADIWVSLLRGAVGNTGYSHQWANPGIDAAQKESILSLCMASTDSADEKHSAAAAGYRTFRVRLASAPILPGEFICPASDEAGKRKTCAECKACDGSTRGARQASPVIIVHGSKASRFKPA
jgi:hypothetical protein